jgi:hypothetical protein
VTGELLGLLALITELNQAGILANGITLTGQLLIVFFLLAGLYYAGERVVQTAETAKKEEDILKDPPKPNVEGLDLGAQEPQRKLYLP